MKLPDRIALGTMHGKAQAIAPALASLGIAVTVPEGLDTDRFGTFSGEVARQGTMLDAARAKARAAIAATGLPVGLASEGAYGPHPLLPFVPRGQEILLWLDARSGQEIVETLADDSPCYDQVEVTSAEAAGAFLSRIGFPKTAVLVFPAADRDRPVAKGLQDLAQLQTAIQIAAKHGAALVQTDMRAHLNPRRMSVIGQLAQRLASRLACNCGQCGAPGWGLLGLEPGLPCSWCGGPSVLAKGEVHGCTACGARAISPRPDGKTEADPGSCPSCNP